MEQSRTGRGSRKSVHTTTCRLGHIFLLETQPYLLKGTLKVQISGPNRTLMRQERSYLAPGSWEISGSSGARSAACPCEPGMSLSELHRHQARWGRPLGASDEELEAVTGSSLLWPQMPRFLGSPSLPMGSAPSPGATCDTCLSLCASCQQEKVLGEMPGRAQGLQGGCILWTQGWRAEALLWHQPEAGKIRGHPVQCLPTLPHGCLATDVPGQREMCRPRAWVGVRGLWYWSWLCLWCAVVTLNKLPIQLGLTNPYVKWEGACHGHWGLWTHTKGRAHSAESCAAFA